MSGMTLKTYLLIEDLLPLSEAICFTEKEGLVLLKYKDVIEGRWLDKRKKESGNKPSILQNDCPIPKQKTILEIYANMFKTHDGFVNKRKLLEMVSSKNKISVKQAYRRYVKKSDSFEQRKRGRIVFVRAFKAKELEV